MKDMKGHEGLKALSCQYLKKNAYSYVNFLFLRLDHARSVGARGGLGGGGGPLRLPCSGLNELY
jgi:hypothetical protein